MKNILVPTDFSTCANNAAKTAIILAKKAKAEVHFLHIVSTPVEWKKLRKEQEKNFPETLKEIGKAKGKLLEWEGKAREAGLKAKQFLVFDSGTSGIIDHLRDYKHDLIVMGSHGSKGVREMIIGSNTQKVVRHSPAPVLVVKNLPRGFQVTDIVFASDFRKDSVAPFKRVLEFTRLLKADLKLVYVNTPHLFEESRETEVRMTNFIKGYSWKCTTHVHNALNIERGILQFAKQHKCDVIALSTEGRSGIARMLSHSIAEAVANHADVPVLSVNGKGK